jgi:methylthioribose-1-phosphate isomerase
MVEPNLESRPQPLRSIWLDEQDGEVKVIDQRRLPHEFVIMALTSVDDVIHAITAMAVRGAPLIGVTAAYGMYLAARHAAEHGLGVDHLKSAAQRLRATRPTAVNLAWAVNRVWQVQAAEQSAHERVVQSRDAAAAIAEEEVENCRKIGAHGLPIIEALSRVRNGKTVNVLTHCNAGWLACVEYGTATAPIYTAAENGIDVHVWVDETRPRNQGAALTAWELRERGIAHTVVVDNAGGQLMREGRVDAVVVGCDRVAGNGDVANKVGTYLKALAARDNDIPFYVACPVSTIDPRAGSGEAIAIELRDTHEVTHVRGRGADGVVVEVQVVPDGTAALNPAFDVTPARLVTALVTEHGRVDATVAGIGQVLLTAGAQ